MGPGGHIQCLDLVMGAMTGAQWVRNDCLRGSFLAETCLASNVFKVAVISGWNGSYGSMGHGGHVRHLDLVMRALTGAQ